jgi:hypothetical protein
MAFRYIIPCLFLIILICSIESISSTNDIIDDKDTDDFPSFIHPLYFTSYICQRQKQYPLKITKKLCSTGFQSYKSREEKQQQQRGKRVGWTISV